MKSEEPFECEIYLEISDVEHCIGATVYRYRFDEHEVTFDTELDLTPEQEKELTEQAIQRQNDYYGKNPVEDPAVARADYLYDQMKDEEFHK